MNRLAEEIAAFVLCLALGALVLLMSIGIGGCVGQEIEVPVDAPIDVSEIEDAGIDCGWRRVWTPQEGRCLDCAIPVGWPADAGCVSKHLEAGWGHD